MGEDEKILIDAMGQLQQISSEFVETLFRRALVASLALQVTQRLVNTTTVNLVNALDAKLVADAVDEMLRGRL